MHFLGTILSCGLKSFRCTGEFLAVFVGLTQNRLQSV